MLALVGRLGPYEPPRVRVGSGGRPRHDADGALLLDGTVGADSPDTLGHKRSLGAFAEALFAVDAAGG